MNHTTDKSILFSYQNKCIPISNLNTGTSEQMLLLSRMQKSGNNNTTILEYIQKNNETIQQDITNQLNNINSMRYLPYQPYYPPVIPISVTELQMSTANIGNPMGNNIGCKGARGSQFITS